MTEAEVSLRLAQFLALSKKAITPIHVAIDGAQVKMGDKVHFDVAAFMSASDWLPECDGERWQATYRNTRSMVPIVVHSRSGVGDVTTTLQMGRPFVAEAKKGPLARSKSSAEYPLLREALGQLLTIEVVPNDSLLAVAVPASHKFSELADRWRKAPLVRQLGIRILTVAIDGEVNGWKQ
ncbi:MAG: hypothetical protein AB7P08_12510 [Burkholderiales bacterium]